MVIGSLIGKQNSKSTENWCHALFSGFLNEINEIERIDGFELIERTDPVERIELIEWDKIVSSFFGSVQSNLSILSIPSEQIIA